MKKLKSVLGTVSLLIFCFAFIGTVSGAELKFTTQDFAPFSYEIDGVVSGPAVDVIQLICKEMDVACSFRLYPWTRAQKMVEAGKANGMFVLGWNKERAQWITFTPPLMRTEYGFFVRKDNSLEFKTSEDVKGYKVAVYGPSNTSKNLEKIKSALEGELIIDMRYDDESGFKKLSAERVDAVFSNRDVGLALIKKIGIDNVRYAGAYKKLKYYIGFSQQYSEKAVVDKFNDTFKQLHQQGKIQEILKYYSMEPAELE